MRKKPFKFRSPFSRTHIIVNRNPIKQSVQIDMPRLRSFGLSSIVSTITEVPTTTPAPTTTTTTTPAPTTTTTTTPGPTTTTPAPPVQIAVSFDLDGGSGIMSSPMYVYTNQTYGEGLWYNELTPTPGLPTSAHVSKDGYVFLGWYSSDFNIDVEDWMNVYPYDHTLLAVWGF
ncbi:MAG: InlB B-repeat-containing protein [Clostridia bacterium]|nr:InlB B-repeat-containing protein [Clostridia bacterium]